MGCGELCDGVECCLSPLSGHGAFLRCSLQWCRFVYTGNKQTESWCIIYSKICLYVDGTHVMLPPQCCAHKLMQRGSVSQCVCVSCVTCLNKACAHEPKECLVCCLIADSEAVHSAQ